MSVVPHVVRILAALAVVGLGVGSGGAEELGRGRMPSGSFGPVIAQALAFEPAGLCVVPPSRAGGRPEIAVLARREPAIHLFVLERTGILRETATIGLPGLHSALACGDLDGDRGVELVALSADRLRVTILARHRQRIAQTEIAIEAPRSRMVIADITNDGRSDVLLFGKMATGIATVVSPRRGVFRSGPVLVPDLPVADARVLDVNADGVADLAMLDWVASRIELLFGITDTVFSEAVSVAVDGEPVALDLFSRRSGYPVTLAVAVPERGKVLTLGIDATGELLPLETLALRGTATGVALEEVTGDASEDVLVGGKHAVSVFSGLPGRRFSRAAEFSIPAGEGLWTVADIDGDGTQDLVAADQAARRILVLGNARRGLAVRWPDAYAVGRQPRQVEPVDVNADGWDDLVVANLQSGSVSLLVNRGDGTFGGQHSYELPDAPTGLRTVAGVPQGTVYVLAAHATSDQISALEFTAGELSRSELVVIGTGSQPRIQYAAVGGSPPLLRLLVRSSADAAAGSVALSLFEQLKDDQFLERQFLARFPRRISALAVGQFQGSGTPDLVLATYDRAAQRTTLSLAASRGTFEFTTVEPVATFGDSLRGVRDLIGADIDGSGTMDLLMIPDAPRTRIGVVYGANGLSETVRWITDVYPSREIAPIIRDVTGDGRPDIVLLDELRGAVVALYGTGGGGFRPPREVAPGSGVSGVAVGAFRSREAFDLALTSGDQGIVTLLFNPFTP